MRTTVLNEKEKSIYERR